MKGARGRWAVLLLLASFGFSSPLRSQSETGEAPVRSTKPAAPKPTETLDLNKVNLEDMEEAWQSTPKNPGADRQQSVQLKEIVEPLSEYNYASFGRPDPFIQPPSFDIAPKTTGGSSPTSPGSGVPLQNNLQAFGLNELEVKGVWQTSGGEVRAVIQTPRGEGIVVKEGDPISTGKVVSIKRDKVMVRLYRLRADGVREFEDVAMNFGYTKNAPRGAIKLNPSQQPPLLPTVNGSRQPGLPPPTSRPATADLQAIDEQTGAPQVQMPGLLGTPPAAPALPSRRPGAAQP